MYIIDSSILIEANRLHFSLDDKHEFWDWLVDLGNNNLIGIPAEVYEESSEGRDGISLWLTAHKDLFFLEKQIAFPYLKKVMEVYSDMCKKDITDADLEALKADPHIIASALAKEATVVTSERSKYNRNSPPSEFKKIKIPDACQILKVPCITFPQFIWTRYR